MIKYSIFWLILLVISGFFIYVSFGDYYICRVGDIMSRNCFETRNNLYEVDVYRDLFKYNGERNIPEYGLIECKDFISCNDTCYGETEMLGINWCIDSEIIPVAYVFMHPSLLPAYLSISIISLTVFVISFIIAGVLHYRKKVRETIDENTSMIEGNLDERYNA